MASSYLSNNNNKRRNLQSAVNKFSNQNYDNLQTYQNKQLELIQNDQNYNSYQTLNHKNDQNIFSKLLRPPSQSQHKLQLQNKLPKKYQPKFKKPDIENLIQENNNLKLEKTVDKKMIMQLRLKIQQVQKKIKKTQNVNSQVIKAMDKQGNSSVYIEILKNKMHDLNVKYLNAQIQIRQLKKLPNASIFQQNSIQKQYLLSQTIRLKSLLAAMENDQQGKIRIHDQFVKMLKQQNQKLKATIRLLQNDKILLKSRQSIQNKINNDLKKQIDQIKQKMALKQAQIQKLNNQNKDLLFKKANQFKKQQQRRQNQEINKMQKIIQDLKQQKKRAMDNNNQLQQDLHILKQKQKMKSSQLSQMQQKYQIQIKNYQQQLQQLQFQNGNYKNDYYNLLSNNNGNLKKKKSKLEIASQQKVYYKPVKLQQVQIFFYCLYYLIKQKKIIKVQDIFPYNKQKLKCSQLINIFEQKPFSLNKKQAIKIARYLVQDNTYQKVQYDLNTIVQTSLAITIVKAGLNNIQNCFCQTVLDKWKCLIQKAKRLIPTLQNIQSQWISKSIFCQLLSKNIRSPIGKQQIQYVLIKSFSIEQTDTQVMMDKAKLIQVLNNFLNPSALNLNLN